MNKTLKSILSLVLCVCFVLALSACGKQNNDTTANNTDTISAAQCEIYWIASTVWWKTAHCRAEHFISSFRVLRRKNGCWKPENIR